MMSSRKSTCVVPEKATFTAYAPKRVEIYNSLPLFLRTMLPRSLGSALPVSKAAAMNYCTYRVVTTIW
jgi:hypothetical protein